MASKTCRQIRKEEAVFELPVSMIDVVFLLLIFFIVATKFRTPEERLDANLPKDKGLNSASSPVPDQPEIRIKLSEARGRLSIQANQMPVANLDELHVRLRQLSSVFGSGIPVIIDARKNVRYRHVIAALDTCARADMSKIRFQAPANPGGGSSDWWYQ